MANREYIEETENDVDVDSEKDSVEPLCVPEEEGEEGEEEEEEEENVEIRGRNNKFRRINTMAPNNNGGNDSNEIENEEFTHSASSEINVTHGKVTISSQESEPSASVRNPNIKKQESERDIIIQMKHFQDSQGRIKKSNTKKFQKQTNLKDGNLDGRNIFNITFSNLKIL